MSEKKKCAKCGSWYNAGYKECPKCKEEKKGLAEALRKEKGKRTLAYITLGLVLVALVLCLAAFIRLGKASEEPVEETSLIENEAPEEPEAPEK